MLAFSSVFCKRNWLLLPKRSAMKTKASMFLLRAARWKTVSFHGVWDKKDNGALFMNSSRITTEPLRTARCRRNKPLVLRAVSRLWSSPNNILVNSRSPLSHAWCNSVDSEPPSTDQASSLARSGNLSSIIFATPDNDPNTEVS